jgi:hypothetical protein
MGGRGKFEKHINELYSLRSLKLPASLMEF